MILAGGRGTRLGPRSIDTPKPLTQVGGRPLLWHILKHFGHHGFHRFTVALGHGAAVIEDWFVDRATATEAAPEGSRVTLVDGGDPWTISLVDTGLETGTGGRLKRLAGHLGGRPFVVALADGLSTLDLTEMVRWHREHGRSATVAAVRPPPRFGNLDLDEAGRVTEFAEKCPSRTGWINGGYWVLEPSVLDVIDGDPTMFEREPADRLVQRGELMAFRHDGFWRCLDDEHDRRQLDRLWGSGRPPWRVW